MIDYRKIADSVDFYRNLGYSYIEVPWMTSQDVINLTKPADCRDFDTFAGSLVASGEQSFLAIKDQLKVGKKYQCITPCFRDEKQLSDLHRQYFIKNELIWVVEKGFNYEELDKITKDALLFFKQYTSVNDEVTALSFYEEKCVPELGDDYEPMSNDIFINKIEVGSYGFREINGFYWIYGTGCAEPRLSQSLLKKRNNLFLDE